MVEESAALEVLRQQAYTVATHAAWRRGELEYLLHEGQRGVYQQIRASKARRFVFEAGRQFGKSVLLVAFALEQAIRNPGKRIVYGAPTLKMLGEYVHPAFTMLLAGAPPDVAAVWNEAESHYNVPNGAWVHLFGADDERKAGRGRGPPAILTIFDECGFCDVLKTVVEDVFQPSLMRASGMCELYASSPAPTPEHPFTDMAKRAEGRGNYANRTWLDNPMLSNEQRSRVISEQAADSGLTPEQYVKTAKYRREYLAERVVDPLLVAVPEWEEARATQLVALERPALFRGQEGGDFGGVDPHFWVFGYWHHEKGLVIEDELMLRDGQTTMQLGEAVKEKERGLWGTTQWDGTLAALTTGELVKHYGGQVPAWALQSAARAAPPQPWARYVDNDVQLSRDLFASGLLCLPTPKDQKELAVDALRVLIRRRMLWVHPRCVNLDRHLRSTTWENLKRMQWARKGGEHGDGVDALVYLYRNVSREVTTQVSRAADLKRSFLGDSPMARKLARR